MLLRLKQFAFNKNIFKNFHSLNSFCQNNKQMENQQHQNNQKQQVIKQGQSIVSRENNKTFKAKCGIFFGYNGEKYLGMQYQRDTQNTIENTLHKMMSDGGFILKTNQDQLRRIAWSRAARTDKKVHALCNGLSAKLQISQKFALKQGGQKQIDFDKLRNHFNSELPMDIRIFSIQKAAKGFDMRHDALTRVYNYIIPAYIFQKQQDFKQGKVPSLEEQTVIIQKLNNLCKCYLGTHNFRNFTKGYKKDDPRCQRYMISMKAQSVQKQVFQRYWNLHKQEEASGRDLTKQRYIRFTLVGQSFIYHQIRKMIGLLIKIFAQQLEGQAAIKEALTAQKYDLYLAPGQGLYLNRMTFEAYNRRKLKNNQKTIELSEEDEGRILKFRQYLQSQILNHEVKDKIFSSWLLNRFEHKAQQKEDESGEQQEQDDDKRQNQQQEGQKQDKQQENKKINKWSNKNKKWKGSRKN